MSSDVVARYEASLRCTQRPHLITTNVGMSHAYSTRKTVQERSMDYALSLALAKNFDDADCYC